MNELSPYTTYILAAALAWASGFRLYVALLLVGASGKAEWLVLPEDLKILQHNWVLAANSLLVLLEFCADKIPGLDTAWDAVHTFIRIPAGAVLAAGLVGPQDGPAFTLAAGLLGGTITAGTHMTKAGARLLINASPEPFSNWGASLSEDGIVIGGLWLAFSHPIIFLALLLCFALVVIWLAPKMWRYVSTALKKLAGSTR